MRTEGHYFIIKVLDIKGKEHEFNKIYDWYIHEGRLLVLEGHLEGELEQKTVIPMRNIVYVSGDAQRE